MFGTALLLDRQRSLEQLRQESGWELAVYFATMTDRDHHNDQDLVADLIHDSVIARPNTPQGRGSATLQFPGSPRAGVGREALNLLTNATAHS